MAFSKEEIRAAKQGNHIIRFSPTHETTFECTVSKVRGDFVWVRTGLIYKGKTETRLNSHASQILISGGYRK
jgi:hypothetical protein